MLYLMIFIVDRCEVFVLDLDILRSASALFAKRSRPWSGCACPLNENVAAWIEAKTRRNYRDLPL